MSEQLAHQPTKAPNWRITRELGTRKVVALAIVLAAGWYIYDTVHTNMMNSVHWPTLAPDARGLTVLGLRDQSKPGWQRQYVAVESNKSWQIRRPQDDDINPDATGKNDPAQSTDAADRGNDPGATHRTVRGPVVRVEEVMGNCPTVLLGRHFSSADITSGYDPVFDRQYWGLNLHLTQEGASRYWQYSKDHDQERLVFVLNNVVMTCPRMTHMETSSLTIDPIWDGADAGKLANFINKQ